MSEAGEVLLRVLREIESGNPRRMRAAADRIRAFFGRANVTAKQITDLRAETGANFLDCRDALAIHGGDRARAIAWLQRKGNA